MKSKKLNFHDFTLRVNQLDKRNLLDKIRGGSDSTCHTQEADMEDEGMHLEDLLNVTIG